MDASKWRSTGRGLLTALVILAGAGALAEKPGSGGTADAPRQEARPGRGPQGEWRNYYQERERRETYQRQERAQQQRAWQDYNRERQRRSYHAAPPPPPGPTVEIRIGGYFGYPLRVEIGDYYRERARRGFCPPGLAKQGPACLPPGPARPWSIGRPLPPDVIYYPVEPAVQVRLGLPPPGHEFIRVAADILLIAIGTGLVVDAIEDLGR